MSVKQSLQQENQQELQGFSLMIALYFFFFF